MDKHPAVVAVWRYLVRTPSREIRALRLLAPEEGPDALGDVPEEARLLVGRWLTKGSGFVVRKPSPWRVERFGVREHKSSFWGFHIRERIAYQVERIRHWRVVEGEYTEAPNLRADWFVDPPYEVEGKSYGAFGSRFLDFEALGAWCRDRRGQIIVCESIGAAWLPFLPFCRALATNGKGRPGISREAIWHKSDVAPEQMALFAA